MSRPPFLAALAAALAGDPFYRRVSAACGDDETRRLGLLEDYFELAWREARRSGRIDIAGDPASGAAIWANSSDMQAREAAYAERLQGLRELLGEADFSAFEHITGGMEAHLDGVTGLENAWYLSIVGIAPAAQGSGAGRQLLAGGLHAADQAGAACFLETFNERSLGFYGRLGFVVAQKFVEPLTASDYWLMVRPPSA